MERRDAKVLRDSEQIRLVCFQKPQQCAQQRRIGRSRPQLLSPDSGQLDEPLRPARVTKRCRKCGERESDRVIPVCARHGYNSVMGWRGRFWPRS